MGLFEAQIVILRWFDCNLKVAQKSPVCICHCVCFYLHLSVSLFISVSILSYLSLALPCPLTLLSLLPSLCLMQGSRL